MEKYPNFPKIARLSREVVITEKIDGTNAQVSINDISEVNFDYVRNSFEHGDFIRAHIWGDYLGPGRGFEVLDTDRPSKILFIEGKNIVISAGSRTRWICPDAVAKQQTSQGFKDVPGDNYGFAHWVWGHAEELYNGLGVGSHYGEWWGSGVNRGYGLEKGEKRFSLFNTKRWKDERLERDFPWKLDERNQVPECCLVVPIIDVGTFSTLRVGMKMDDLRANGSFAAPGFKNPEGIIIYHTAAGVYFKKTLEADEMSKGEVDARAKAQ